MPARTWWSERRCAAEWGEVVRPDGYAHLAAAAGHPNWVLFSFGSPRREAEARRVLRHPVVPVATTTRAGRGASDGQVWLPARCTGTARVRLIDLAGLPLPGA